MIGVWLIAPRVSWAPPGDQETYGAGTKTSSAVNAMNTAAEQNAVQVCLVTPAVPSPQPDPGGFAVGELLLLPDRHLGLDPVDQLPADLQCLGPVRGTDRDHDREVTHPQPAGP